MADRKKAAPLAAVPRKAAVLTLSTTDFDRPLVAIDGKMYEMRATDELSVGMIRGLGVLGERIKTAQKDEDADAKLDAMADAIAESVDLIMVELPPAVLNGLTMRQQTRIVETFTKLANEETASASASATA